jgi:hypothetical protein
VFDQWDSVVSGLFQTLVRRYWVHKCGMFGFPGDMCLAGGVAGCVFGRAPGTETNVSTTERVVGKFYDNIRSQATGPKIVSVGCDMSQPMLTIPLGVAADANNTVGRDQGT